MAWGAVAGAAIGVVGGALNGGDGGQKVEQKQIDPNLQRYLYGNNGYGGLLGQATALQQQQSQTGGLNGYQLAGQEMQRRTLLDPAYTRGFDLQRAAGAGLLGAGAAGNPFTSGQVAQNGRVQMQQPQQLRVPMPQIQPAAMDYGYAATPIPQSNASAAPMPSQDQLSQWIDEYLKQNAPKPAAPVVELWNGG